jgi:hypothetical protein
MDCAVTVLEGTQPAVTFRFRNLDGEPASPTTMYVRVESPGGSVDEYTSPDAALTNPLTGVWRFLFPFPPGPGIWKVYGAGTAGVIAAAETAVGVKASTVAPAS